MKNARRVDLTLEEGDAALVFDADRQLHIFASSDQAPGFAVLREVIDFLTMPEYAEAREMVAAITTKRHDTPLQEVPSDEGPKAV